VKPGPVQGEVNAAARTDHFAGLGYDKGVKSALSNFTAKQRGQKSHVPHQKPVSKAAGAQGLGNVRASSDELGNAINRMGAAVRAKSDLKNLARDRVRER
jgi:hypothetical protein